VPYQHLLKDPVIFILMAASVISWAIIIDCILTIRKSAFTDRKFVKDKSFSESALYHINDRLTKHIDSPADILLPAIDSEITIQRQKLERQLPLLGVIGSTAPYMGLLGTVIGIIQAFQSIQAHNNMSPSIVAGGISTALVATAIGLAVAIPAVAAHHLISSAISHRVSDWEDYVTEQISEKRVK
jgi:biopolymer transport protein ExbB/TolQ